MNNPTKTYTVQEARSKLEYYCAYQDRCHKEVVKKLKDMKMTPLAVDEIVGHLIEHRYLNEERFAKSFVRGKFNIKKWGKNRIVRELKIREISKYNIELALKEIDPEDYLTQLDGLAKKRLAAIKEADPFKKKRKLAEYLLYRGWESNLVYEKVNELANN